MSWLLVSGLHALLFALVCASSTAGAQETDSSLSLDLNLPSFRLDVRQGGVLLSTYRVAVGMRRYQTPRGTFAVSQIEWNPWWIPPAREWAKKDTVTPPGPGNPMGKVKLYFRPLYFLHGTPAVSSIGSAASHGCVRMRDEDAVALARLLHVYASPEVPPELIDSLERTPRATRMIELTWHVPISLRYDLSEVRDDSLYLYRDIYGRVHGTRVGDAMSTLQREGMDTARVRRAVLRSAATGAARRTVVIALDSLIDR